MMMQKRLMAFLLCAVLAVSLSVPAFATTYPDLEEHWARAYMEDLADRGYLSGYTDGSMGPERNITSCEALVFLSRFYKVDADMTEWISSDYSAYVASVVPSSLSWAYDEIMLCLAADIITENQLASLDLSAPIEKELLSVLLVRTMQLTSEAEAEDGSALSFDDLSDITSDCLGYIAVLVDAGIITGDDKNCFTPHSNVTRAVVATMVVRALDYVEDLDMTLTLTAYDGYSKNAGIIMAVSGSSFNMRSYDGVTYKYSIPLSASVTVNGSVKSFGSAYVGCSVTVKKEARIVASVAIESDSSVKWVQGRLSSYTTSSTANTLTVTNIESGDATKYTVPSDAVITENGKTATFSSLTKNYFVTLKIDNDKVEEITSNPCDYEMTGTISSLVYSSVISLEVTDANEMVYRFEMDISNLPKIMRGETVISIDRLMVGDVVKFSVDNCVLASIVTSGTEDSYTGDLTYITTTTTGLTWGITAEDGTTYSFSVDESCGVYSGSKAILLSDIKIGDTVTVVTYGNVITEINLESSASSATKVSGKVLTVDTSTKTVTILVSGKLVYVYAGNVGAIINSATGGTVRLSAITADTALVAYGSYTSSTAFTATSIIVEG
ncbi:MAG: S-layer homology domain-containing protein [Clostridia bacterium]|nr:S-layer homology domain-containing protein [Clostridia bacterium]